MKKIGVVNRTNLKNYGSVLQVYALVEAVKCLGYEAEVVWEQGNLSKNFDFRLNKIINFGLKLIIHPKLIKVVLKTIKEVRNKPVPSDFTIRCFEEFVDNNIIQKMYSQSDLRKIAKSDEYFKFICGSDQIWCSTTIYVDPLMYLRFAPKHKRIAYAPSLGRDFIPDYNRKIMKKYISEIPYISVRENKGSELIKALTGIDAPVVLDPTLLWDKSFWERVSKPILEKDYILCYFLDEPSYEVQQYIVDFADKRSIISLHNHLTYLDNNEQVIYTECGPDKFLSYIEKADYIFTDSYHGMLFSINYEKPFCAIERNYQTYDQSTRQKSILSLLGLTSRYVSNIKDIDISDFNYQEIIGKLTCMRSSSKAFLRNALQAECKDNNL